MDKKRRKLCLERNAGQEAEVAVSKQKLVHMEAELKMINELKDDAFDINSLPNEIILNVFSYLEQNQLGQIARVCRKWNVLTKSPVLWKKVNVKFSPSHRCQTTVAESFIKGLPSCVTSIRLHFMAYRRWIGKLDFAEFCVKLQEKCPQLETLMLTNSRLSNSLPAVINICSQFLQYVKNLIFHHSRFSCNRSTDEYFGICKVKIFELFNCYIDYSSKSPFSKMPHLRQLNLFHTMVPLSWFQDDTSFLNQLHILNVGRTLITFNIFPTIQNHGQNLKELYLCFCFLQDGNLTFTDSALPHLKTICLSLTLVTCEDVVSLIQSCPSLENVYVNDRVAESFAAHPFVVANRCKSGIVKAIDVIHKHHVDYSHTLLDIIIIHHL